MLSTARSIVFASRAGAAICHAGWMQKWEYRIFASHLDPAELVVIMNESGRDGWELVSVVAVTDYQPLELVEPDLKTAVPADAEEIVELEAFRYIFKRPVA
jgi:hypothetical protein